MMVIELTRSESVWPCQFCKDQSSDGLFFYGFHVCTHCLTSACDWLVKDGNGPALVKKLRNLVEADDLQEALLSQLADHQATINEPPPETVKSVPPIDAAAESFMVGPHKIWRGPDRVHIDERWGWSPAFEVIASAADHPCRKPDVLSACQFWWNIWFAGAKNSKEAAYL